jgi:hypothetical protein
MPKSPPKRLAAPHSKSSKTIEVDMVRSKGRKYPQKPRTPTTLMKTSRIG